MSIQPTTNLCNSSRQARAVGEPYPVRLPRASRALRGAESLVGCLCPSACGGGVSATQRSTDFGQLGERMQCPVWVVPGDARRWSCRRQQCPASDGATALIHPEELFASWDGPLKREDSRGKHQRVMEAIGSGATFDQLLLRLQCSPAALAPQPLALECQRELLCESGLHWRKPRP